LASAAPVAAASPPNYTLRQAPTAAFLIFEIPALIVFGRIRGSKVDQAAVFLEKDAEAKRAIARTAH